MPHDKQTIRGGGTQKDPTSLALTVSTVEPQACTGHLMCPQLANIKVTRTRFSAYSDETVDIT